MSSNSTPTTVASDSEHKPRKRVETMEWLRNWSWRLAILSLPWQTRLMFSDASVYVSWFFILLSIVIAIRYRKHDQKTIRYSWLMCAIVLLLIIASAVTTFSTGTWQWWIQILLLGFFGWSLVVSKVDTREFLLWNVIALVPHALLAFQQGITQQVIGTKWLGIASQLPETRGVAVVDVDGVRHLRAYGGMPYPNILGGWLAFGFPAALWLAITSSDRRKQILLSIVSALLVVALVLTHSRSAWIATIMILVLLGFHFRKSQKIRSMRIPFVVSIVTLLVAIVWQWPMLTTRVTGEGRLETRSIDERVSGVQAGITIFRDHPWFGVGRNAFGKTFDIYPMPHNIPLLMLAETGLVGVAGTALLIVLFFKSLPIDKRRLILVGVPLAVIALVDHYPWTYWSGQDLAMLCVIWCFLVSHNIDKSPDLG